MSRYLIDKANRRSSGPLRCEGIVESTGKRCTNKVARGHTLCKMHDRDEQRAFDDESSELSHYALGSSEALRGKLLEIAALPIEARRSLDQEVELLIHMTKTAWKVYDSVCVEGKLDIEGKRNVKARGAARVCVQDAVDQLSKAQLANAKLESLRQGQVTTDTLKQMACQIMDILDEELEDERLFKVICRRIEAIKIQDEQASVSMTID